MKPKPASFYDLPRELRDEIYKLALPMFSTINLTTTDDNVVHSEPGLIRTSPQIRSETLSLYYSSNTFAADDYDPTIAFLKSLHPSILPLIRDLRFPDDRPHYVGGVMLWENQAREWLEHEWEINAWAEKGLRASSVSMRVFYPPQYENGSRASNIMLCAWVKLPEMEGLKGCEGDEKTLAEVVKRNGWQVERVPLRDRFPDDW